MRELYIDALRKMGGPMFIAPRTPGQASVLTLALGTAGVTEEIIFRGFLIFVLAQIFPLWAAAILSLLIFVMQHQPRNGSVLSGLTVLGFLFTLLYLLSGSLLPGMVLHCFVNLGNFYVYWRVIGPKGLPPED